MDTNETPNTKCTACRVDDKDAAGEEVTDRERTAWSMWGCTCTAEDEADAIAWMDRVTR